MAAGFLDRVAQPPELGDVARGIAGQLAQLNMAAHAASMLRARDRAADGEPRKD